MYSYVITEHTIKLIVFTENFEKAFSNKPEHVDFKNVVSKIVEVSPRLGSAKHLRPKLP